MIANLELARLDTAPDPADQQFLCMLEARRYWYAFEPAYRIKAEACLSQLIQVNGGFAQGRAALALFAIDDSRMEPGAVRDSHLAHAKGLLMLASADDAIALQARMGLAACMGDIAAAAQNAQQLLILYPNNPAILADVGSKLGLAAGDWAQAILVEAKAMALNPRPSPWYPLSSVVKAMSDVQHREALSLLEAVPQRNFATGYALLMATGGALRDEGIVRAAQMRLAELGYASGGHIEQLIATQCWSEAAKSPVRAGLRAALELPKKH